ncbi:MAG TPA: aconitase X catalytic domain-containing protein [Bryobacteraceae bacterium]|nr:aconitase X catalytic domain-containing protein [Bryobacteraceae bacterium]
MRLTDGEQAMLDGKAGAARQKAMELLVRYGEVLGAERFVDTNNVAGVPGSSSLFLRNYYQQQHGDSSYQAIYSLYDLDSEEIVPVPQVESYCCHLQGGMDPENWTELGMSREAFEHFREDEAEVAARGIQVLKTCTPYLAGNVPVKGEHCAWMESSAVVFCNSVLGARTNTEGRESTSAAALTGKIPDWGFHRDEFRYGSHRINVEVRVESVMDWGLLGYFIGYAVEEKIPVITGPIANTNLIRHKHFGAAAASSGGVEMYHMVGITPEAATLEMAFGGKKAIDTIWYGPKERRDMYERLNSIGSNPEVDYVMLGCPHASIEQIWEIARLLEGRKIRSGCRLWVFTSRSVKSVADLNGYTKTIQDAGGLVMTDTCSAISKAVPKGTRVVALDSAKQAHYLPAMVGIEAWFGTTQDCVHAALTGRWNGELR